MKRVRPWIARLSVVCAGLVFGAAAHAGNIRGSWDPQFNGTFTGTGFLGEINFFVPDGCLSGAPNTVDFIDDTDGCSGGGMFLIDAEVSLYNWPDTMDIISTITFAPPAPMTDPILGILVEFGANGNGNVIGLDTLPIGPQSSGVPPLQAPSPLYLLFSADDEDDENWSLPGGAYLLPQQCEGFEPEICSPDFSAEARSNPGLVTFVPEPGSLALLLSAMGVGWLARRRIASR
jgi:hypothetical protein